MGWYEGVEGVTHAVELYFDSVIKPHYGWVFPEGPDRVNIGICYDAAAHGPNARERFQTFIDRRLAKRLKYANQIGPLVGHPIATTHRPTALAAPGVLLAGEAARLVDPATAEGICFALASGRLAGNFLAETLVQGGHPSAERLAPYGNLVREQLGSRLQAGQIMLQVLKTPALDFALAFGSLRPVREFLTRTLSAA